MKLAQYPLDETFGTDACLRALAEQYGTPLLVYDRKTLENRVRMLQKAFAWAPDFRQFFRLRLWPIQRCWSSICAPVAVCCAAVRRS